MRLGKLGTSFHFSKAGNTDVAAELLELKNQLAEKEADELVNMALKDGKISAAQTEWARKSLQQCRWPPPSAPAKGRVSYIPDTSGLRRG